MAKQDVPEMRLLTLVRMEGSTVSRVDGDEHTITNSGELLQEGIHRFVLLRALLLDSFCMDDLQSLTELRGYLTELVVALIIGAITNFDELYQPAKRQRGPERVWGDSSRLGFPCGAPVGFIEQGVVGIVDIAASMAEIRRTSKYMFWARIFQNSTGRGQGADEHD
jgi:hypothetical protein